MRLRLLILALGNFAMGVDTFVIAPILDPMARDFTVSRTTAGWLITGFALAYAVCGPLLAALTGHRSPRPLLLAALTVFAAGNVLTAVAPGYWVGMLGRVVAGAGASMYTANALAVARAMAPPERSGRATATVVGGLTTAIVLGLPLGAWLGANVGWRPTLWVVVALTAVAAAGIATTLPPLAGQAATSLRARLAPLSRPAVLITLMATWLCLSTSWTVYTYVDQITREATGGDAAKTSFVLLSFGVGAVTGNLLTGRLTDRLGPARTITYAAPLLVVAATAAPLLSGTFLAALALAVVWGVFHWMVNVPQQIRVAAAAPGSAPLVLGLHQSTIYVGISTGGVAGAVGFTLGGAHGVGYAALAVGLAALAVLAVSLRITRRPAAARTVTEPAAEASRAG
ncbi:MFS transporter [Sphaerisporangium krabiense]|uniref:Putative MFS family arabinose efflux permease n=1 Tax=Sphaerisporangium krabiense TaxID=763782 RepID=A0A7W8Z092_9ACTN|nr:MFS transporter [Sphaerisporangium krabiense]MBB5624780.1 putative MFS family arabinose efflux permease [Sphaerisporangium krabiense]GII66520.1 MFS transporter [Sphaerisporangium krabiense]